MPLEIYKKLRELALTEFTDIVEDTDFIRSETGRPRKLRIYLIDGTFLDICTLGKNNIIPITGRGRI